MKFSPTAILAMALLQQHDARRDILIEPALRWHAAITARGRTGGIRNWGRNRAIKTNWLVYLFVNSIAQKLQMDFCELESR